MLDRHYAPRARLVVADRSYLPDLIDDQEGAGLRVGAILYTPGIVSTPVRRVIVLSQDPAQYAAGLYAALHDLDDAGVDIIVAEEAPPGSEWLAVRDRLARAGHR
jgi:L-threonylcarbamoyladenylate synthase